MAPKPPISAEDRRRIKEREERLQETLLVYEEILAKREIEYGARMLPIWTQINKSLEEAVNALYVKYADEKGKLPDSREFEAARLKMLQQQAAFMLQKLQDTDDILGNNIAYNYVDSYFFTAFALQEAVPFLPITVPLLTEAAVVGIVVNPWLGDSTTYSDRNRANTVMLANKLSDTMLEATVKGWGIQKTARRIEELTGEGLNNSLRLARTEFTRASSQASSQVFLQNADVMEGKRWNATLDNATAPKDAKNDGKVYRIEYDTPESPGKPGERIPNHPNCRCKWSPVLSALGVREGERAARETSSGNGRGARIYTKARTYKEYAKQQGIDLDERLKNDNPRRYLRRNEK